MLYQFLLTAYILGLIVGFAGIVTLVMTVFNSDRFKKVYKNRRIVFNTIGIISSIFIALIINSAMKSKDFPQMYLIVISLLIAVSPWIGLLYYAIKVHKKQPKRTVIQTMFHMRKSSI